MGVYCKWSQNSDSNRKPVDYKSTALPIELFWLAPQVGLEPTTYRLTAERSTIELLRIVNGRRDRIRTYGLCAPNAPRYQTAPLSVVLVPMAGVEPAWAMPDRF